MQVHNAAVGSLQVFGDRLAKDIVCEAHDHKSKSLVRPDLVYVQSVHLVSHGMGKRVLALVEEGAYFLHFSDHHQLTDARTVNFLGFQSAAEQALRRY